MFTGQTLANSARHRNGLSEKAGLIFQTRDIEEAPRRRDEWMEVFEKTPDAVACLEAVFEDVLAAMTLLKNYRKRYTLPKVRMSQRRSHAPQWF